MKLVPFKKERELFPTLSLFDDFVNRFFNDNSRDDSRLMAVDVVETEKTFVVKANLPGINKDNIKISVQDNQLQLEAHYEENHEEKKSGTVIRSERYVGNYQRYITLPENCDSNNIKAALSDGVLTLNIPKMEPKPKKLITVE